ncbi:DUF4157 domain-containing protein [Kitasatospora sp. NPDC058965]|uniref:eCIS core domain-containing protein n=1 Tax=Kitasatospora sp. NPDC058965 TaxID=3346682 RepID=UPI0036765461
MRDREQADRRRPDGAAGQAPPTGPAHPPQVRALLDLQGAAGNAVVVQLLRRSGPDQEAHQHADGCGHPAPQVQRSAVHDVLRSTGQPLDATTRSDMEGRLGADFSDVRVHSDAAAKASAAEVGARAYTSGNHVVIGEGGSDRHTLAHELTHVIQQRQGPVAGTDNGAGLRVSDPSDRYEREAEANAVRVMRRPASAGPAPRSAEHHHESSAPVQRTAVQRVFEQDDRDADGRGARQNHDVDRIIYDAVQEVRRGIVTKRDTTDDQSNVARLARNIEGLRGRYVSACGSAQTGTAAPNVFRVAGRQFVVNLTFNNYVVPYNPTACPIGPDGTARVEESWGAQFDYPRRPLTVEEFAVGVDALWQDQDSDSFSIFTHEKMCIFLAPICAELTRNPQALASTMMIGARMLSEGDATARPEDPSVFTRLSMTTGSTDHNAAGAVPDSRGAMAGVNVMETVSRREVATAISAFHAITGRDLRDFVNQQFAAPDWSAGRRQQLITVIARQLSKKLASQLGD